MERWKYAAEPGKHGREIIDLLISCLNDDDKWVRCLVIDALGEIRDPRLANPLIADLRDLDQDVRFMAADTLGRREGTNIL